MSKNTTFPIHLNNFTMIYIALGAGLVLVPLISYKLGKLFGGPRINVVKTQKESTTYINGDNHA